jgi:hypothetical protein
MPNGQTDLYAAIVGMRIIVRVRLLFPVGARAVKRKSQQQRIPFFIIAGWNCHGHLK